MKRVLTREQRLEYFMENYLPKNEVLYRLPLDIQIEPFWADLVNKRKARAVILPLENGAGMPYWYTLTDKMIEASSRLCEEAVADTSSFDPFRMEMTSAMTKEMFFTSYVEGAQISLDDSMDFLTSGREPADIGEQMVWNNRQAWEQMCASLYRPMDSEYLKYLAYCLTDGMDNCADDYRSIDSHPIAAMGTENCSVPPAYRIPAMMEGYCNFLMDSGIHPLIKAAAGSAYLLAVRPFPEGNERLSRMVPAAVLIRSGYSFFKDVSLSGVIATENYYYYKAMCDILRDKNGDLTYFMEYFLGMLVRAMEQLKEKKHKKENESTSELASRERMMAAVPLAGGVSAIFPPDDNGGPSGPGGGKRKDDARDSSADSKPAANPVLPAVITAPDSGMQETASIEKTTSDNTDEPSTTKTWRSVEERAISIYEELIADGVFEIDRAFLSKKYGFSGYIAKTVISELEKQGCVAICGEKIRGKRSKYTVFDIELPVPVEEVPDSRDPSWLYREYMEKRTDIKLSRTKRDALSHRAAIWIRNFDNSIIPEGFKGHLACFVESNGYRAIRITAFLVRLIFSGSRSFQAPEYRKAMDIGKNPCTDDMNLAKEYEIIKSTGLRNFTYYELNIGKEEAEVHDQSEEAESARKKLLKNADGDPDFAGYWTLPGEKNDEEENRMKTHASAAG